MKSFKILNSKKVQLLILLSLVLTLTLGVYIYSGKEIDLEVDGNKTNMVSYSKTVEEFLQKEEVDFQEGAYINLPLDTKIEDKLNIIIINPKTYIIKEKDGIKEIRSIYETVGEVIKDQEIELEELDYTAPTLAERLEEGATIEIFRVREEVVVTKSKIEFEKKKENTNSLYKGKTKLKQKGQEGELTTHTKQRFVNDVLEKSEVLKEEVTVEKKDNIILVGTKAVPKPAPAPKTATRSKSRTAAKTTTSKKLTNSKAPSRGGSRNVARSMVMSASAYDLSYQSTGKRPGDRGYGITASGMKAGPGVVAVDPRVIPLGTRLYIEGYGNAIAGDTGGAIKGNRIDLFFSSHSAAMNFGRRSVNVQILQ